MTAKILSLCDYSGAWSAPYADAGYNIIKIDIKSGRDVRLLKYPGKIYGLLAAPPCTHFSASGAVWWKKKGDAALLEGLSIFDACCRIALFCEPEFWCFENPVGRLRDYIGAPKMWFDPCDFGDPYTKKTGLWGRFNIPVKNPVKPIKAPPGHHSLDCHLKNNGLKLGDKRQQLRSVTPAGFSRAFFKANNKGLIQKSFEDYL